ncbi:ribonucleoside-diphosphate reductase subunit beta [Erwinia sp. CPCC 100877]|nr:ribonucleoside-diphosphate reductase subunit beta [Erwinia sp. CPCC 100877]
MTYLHYKAINWNEIEDELDHATWERATSLFWLDTRIPVSNDLADWQALTVQEQEIMNKNAAALATLTTFQSLNGYKVIKNSPHTQQESAIYNNIQFIETVHTKTYNALLMAFNSSDKVEAMLQWADEDPQLQKRLDLIHALYADESILKKRLANLCLEGILMYSGLYLFLRYWTQKRFTNVAEMIKLVVMNESLHCLYLANKLRISLQQLDKKEQDEFKEWTYTTINYFVVNELDLIDKLYAGADYGNEAEILVQQAANKVLLNLGFEPLFAGVESELANIQSLLDKLTKHDLEPRKSLANQIETAQMSDEDYDF